jgi:hypothetical protein
MQPTGKVMLRLVPEATLTTRKSRRPPKEKGLVRARPLIDLVPVKGVEPSTFALRMRCSTN